MKWNKQKNSQDDLKTQHYFEKKKKKTLSRSIKKPKRISANTSPQGKGRYNQIENRILNLSENIF